MPPLRVALVQHHPSFFYLSCFFLSEGSQNEKVGHFGMKCLWIAVIFFYLGDWDENAFWQNGENLSSPTDADTTTHARPKEREDRRWLLLLGASSFVH